MGYNLVRASPAYYLRVAIVAVRKGGLRTHTGPDTWVSNIKVLLDRSMGRARCVETKVRTSRR